MQAQEFTLRQKILQLITNRPQDSSTLARQLNIKPRGVEGHLEHIRKSVETNGGEFVIHPAHCLDCRFTFRDRERMNPPSRCPKCKSESIALAAFEVRRK